MFHYAALICLLLVSVVNVSGQRVRASRCFWLSPATRALMVLFASILGLAPQALRFRPVRGLGS